MCSLLTHKPANRALQSIECGYVELQARRDAINGDKNNRLLQEDNVNIQMLWTVHDLF